MTKYACKSFASSRSTLESSMNSANKVSKLDDNEILGLGPISKQSEAFALFKETDKSVNG
jgi:hypothetical protein